MAKLLDLCAIYSVSNLDVLDQIVNNIFELEKKYVLDFKETFDLLLGLLKR